MDLPVLEVSPLEARRKINEYRNSKRRGADQEYQIALKVYQEAAMGLPIIDMREVLEVTGFRDTGYPRVAIARADRKKVRFRRNSWNFGRVWFNCSTQGDRATETLQLEYQIGNTGLVQNEDGRHPTLDGWAVVPNLPPEIRERNKVDLSKHFILFEVDVWKPRQRAVPPEDPFLLKHLQGDLFAILDQWDLTEVEQLVLGQTRK